MPIEQPYLLASLTAVLGALLVLWVLLPVLRVRRRRRRVERAVRRLGADLLRDVLIPDGLGGHLQVDYLVLAPRAVFVLDVREYEGAIFAGATLDAWSQMVGRRSFRFSNPLVENRLRCAAVDALAEDVPVAGRVVFTGEAWFPKGVPLGVSRLAELTQDVASDAGEGQPGPKLRQAWARVQQAAEPAATQAAVRPAWRARAFIALVLAGAFLFAARGVLSGAF